MARYAMIVTATGLVDNVIVYDGVSPFTPPTGIELRLADDNAEPGGTWNGSEFVRAPTVVPTRMQVLMSQDPEAQVWNEELATFEDGVWSDGDYEDRPPEDIAADKAELLVLLHEKLAKSQYSSLSMQEMNRMLKLERE